MCEFQIHSNSLIRMSLKLRNMVSCMGPCLSSVSFCTNDVSFCSFLF